MAQRPAIEIALDLKTMPSLAKVIRKRPLPPEVTPVIRVAAGSAELALEFSTKYGYSNSHIREACVFFLQQAVVFSGADSHRTLGVAAGATLEQIRTHRRWLLMWLHPDRNKDKWESALFERVQKAASALGDAAVPAATSPARKTSKRRRSGRRLLRPIQRSKSPARAAGPVKTLILIILAAAALFLSALAIVSAFGAEATLHSFQGRQPDHHRMGALT